MNDLSQSVLVRKAGNFLGTLRSLILCFEVSREERKDICLPVDHMPSGIPTLCAANMLTLVCLIGLP